MKIIQKLKNLATPTAYKIGLLLTLISLGIYVTGLPFFNAMELKAFDLHLRQRGKIAPGNEVAIVAIDEKSIDAIGRWPWPRTRIAQLVESLNRYQAKVVAFDVIFSEPDESSGVSVMRNMQKRFRDRDVKTAFEAAVQEADNDAHFAEVLKNSPSVILGYFFFTGQEEIKHLKEKSEKMADYRVPGRFTSIRSVDGGTHQPTLPAALAVERNIGIIQDAGSDFGNFNIFPDSDGTVRWASLAMQFKDDTYPHLSLEAVRKYLGSPPLIMNTAEYGVDSIQLGDRTIETDEQGRLLINYRGPQNTFPYYSASDVINGTVPAAALKDKIVLIGATAVGIYDMRVTPFSGTFPGVEIHANIIDNILRGDSISRPDWIALFDFTAILLIGLILSYIISRISPLNATLVTVGLIILYIIINNYVFTIGRIWLTAVYPIMTMIFVFGGVTTYRFMTEERKKREIKDAFGRYVAPSLVNDILKDPTKLVLGGEERRLTVFFSDIRGFTTISEGLTPQALVKLINDYLTPMTDLILKSGGTVDKYMGDAIMAFWGAPVWQEDHAIRAARTALQMMEKLREMQADWEKRGLPRIDIGIGLSTGALTVGNMGSHMRFDYTVMGDSVNLGSRLEGLNKEYGTHIIVPKFTYEELHTTFLMRQLDNIRVKGKKVPIKIYELMGEKASADGKMLQTAELFEAGLQAYMTRDWDRAEKHFLEVLNLKHGDGPSTTLLARIKDLRAAKLPEDWDGVYVMTKK